MTLTEADVVTVIDSVTPRSVLHVAPSIDVFIDGLTLRGSFTSSA